MACLLTTRIASILGMILQNRISFWMAVLIHMRQRTASVRCNLMLSTKFMKIEFLYYHTEDGKLVMKNIDFSKGYLSRIVGSRDSIRA